MKVESLDSWTFDLMAQADIWVSDTADYWVANHQGNPQDPQDAQDPQVPVDCVGRTTPRNTDVLFGRGTGFHNYHGNVIYRRAVVSRSELHSSLTSKGKTQLIRNLIEELWSQGVRFLQRDKEGRWYEVDEPKVLHKKVSHCFRTMKRTEDRRRAEDRNRLVVPI